MIFRSFCLITALTPALAAQHETPARTKSQPIYRVTIVERTTPAINYSHRSEPTKIDFRGTALLTNSHGEATIENRRGATLVDAHFDHVPPPTRFGAQYLTYVVWAVSPDGRAQNIGELVPNGSDKGSLKASTPMQAFALIVTAEPYFSVTQPSDVVVMENALRPETVGQVEQVNATYELLPRKEYTYTLNSAASAGPATGAAVSMPEYEALTATYQAKNAIQIAIAAGAERYAPDRLARAQQLYDQARVLPRKTLSEQVVATMRESAQAAEDARAVAAKLSQEDALARQRAQTMEQQKENAAAADRAREDAERAEAEAARSASAAAQTQRQMEAQRYIAQPPPPAQTSSADRLAPVPTDASREVRADVRRRLSASGFQILDAPRGLVVVIPDASLESGGDAIRGRLSAVASAVLAYPGLRVEIDGNTDSGASENLNQRVSEELAARVRDMLVAQRVPPAAIAAYGYGGARPVASNKTASGRLQNRRVEIVIAGAPIGSMPVWERTYNLERRPLPR